MHYGLWLGRLALAAAALMAADPAAAADSRAARPRASCDGAIRHPIDVQVEALEPIIAGATVRLHLTARAPIVSLTRVTARIERAGGARVVGESNRTLGRVNRGSAQSVEFTVVAPPSGERRLIEFVVAGEGPNGPLRRGAVFNLLPGGGEQPERVLLNAAGERVAEYRGRRIVP